MGGGESHQTLPGLRESAGKPMRSKATTSDRRTAAGGSGRQGVL
ncbi:MAG: hypothetical protein NVS4B12_24390 [Ktedonobacteraceae bacterium]